MDTKCNIQNNQNFHNNTTELNLEQKMMEVRLDSQASGSKSCKSSYKNGRWLRWQY